MSALAATIPSPFTARAGAGAARWLRALLSLLVAVGILAVALPVAFGSVLPQGGVEPVQVFSSSSLLRAEASGGAQLSTAGMVPGQSRSATVHVSNAGSAPSLFSLSAEVADRVGPGGAPLSGALLLRIEPAGSAAPLYSGPLGQMPRLSLGGIPAGGERAYRFMVTLPESAGNEVMGSALSAGFAWGAA